MNILGGAEVGVDWKHLKHVQQRIGVGTFLKVRGGGGQIPMGTASNFLGRNLTYPQNQFSPQMWATLFSRKCRRCFVEKIGKNRKK